MSLPNSITVPAAAKFSAVVTEKALWKKNAVIRQKTIKIADTQRVMKAEEDRSPPPSSSASASHHDQPGSPDGLDVGEPFDWPVMDEVESVIGEDRRQEDPADQQDDVPSKSHHGPARPVARPTEHAERRS